MVLLLTRVLVLRRVAAHGCSHNLNSIYIYVIYTLQQYIYIYNYDISTLLEGLSVSYE